MIIIDKNKCIGCGECIKDCFPNAINEVEGKAAFTHEYRCMRCGHCVAVCPVNAVIDDGWKIPERSEDAFLDFLLMRRTVRRFTEEKVSESDISKIIRAGQYSPTACNYQLNEFIVIQGNMKQYQRMALDSLASDNAELLASGGSAYNAKRFARWKEDFEADPENCKHLLFNAPLVIIVTSMRNDLRDAACAAAYMELQAFSMGLGVLYSGMFCRAVDYSKELREKLGISDERVPARCLVIGHPDVRYHRPAPRKDAQIKYIEG